MDSSIQLKLRYSFEEIKCFTKEFQQRLMKNLFVFYYFIYYLYFTVIIVEEN